jgi:hypothetical protein
LTQYLPFELVDDVLSETKTVQRRLRDLPSRVGVYFVLALMLFPRLGYARVWQKLTAGLRGWSCRVRRRRRCEICAVVWARPRSRRSSRSSLGRLGQPRTPGVSYRGLRTVAFDGCNSLPCPTPNATVPGWAGSVTGWASPATRPSHDDPWSRPALAA